jgi:hypothetical protein
LKDKDCFDELACEKWAAAEFAEDAPGFQLGVGAFAGSAELGVSGVGSLL